LLLDLVDFVVRVAGERLEREPRHFTKTFLQVGHPGIYLAVREEGVVSPGDRIERVAEDERRIAVTDMLRLIVDHDADPDDVRRLLEVPALAAVWRAEFERRLAL
jgi:MOSC domain-containing protein YiiM